MKRVVSLAALGVALLGAAPAHAFQFGTPASEHPYRSAQNFALELRFSPYKPDIDAEPGLTGRPYESNFGSSPRLMVALELDWQTLRIPAIGTIGPGVGVGYTSMSADVQTTSGRPSGDETGLTIYPFWGAAVLRVDTLWRNLGFPLVPYAKAGIGTAIWRATNTGNTSVANGVSGKGVSWGTHLALGAAIALDALDKGSSRNMDVATGINNTYLFFEVYSLGLNGISQSHALRVGATTWAAGLAFEF